MPNRNDQDHVHFDLGADQLASGEEIAHMDDPWEPGHSEVPHEHHADMPTGKLGSWTDDLQVPGV